MCCSCVSVIASCAVGQAELYFCVFLLVYVARAVVLGYYGRMCVVMSL